MRPIDADALAKSLSDRHDRLGGTTNPVDHCIRDVLLSVIEDIEEAPTLDYAPVKHAEWDCDDVYVWRCTLCKKWLMVEDQEGEMNFCPNCGANMMDGGKNDVRITD